MNSKPDDKQKQAPKQSSSWPFPADWRNPNGGKAVKQESKQQRLADVEAAWF